MTISEDGTARVYTNNTRGLDYQVCQNSPKQFDSCRHDTFQLASPKLDSLFKVDKFN